jgi:hypothetical protein
MIQGIQGTITLACDDCHQTTEVQVHLTIADPYGVGTEMIAVARQEAQREGWEFSSGKDLCPPCNTAGDEWATAGEVGADDAYGGYDGYGQEDTEPGW